MALICFQQLFILAGTDFGSRHQIFYPTILRRAGLTTTTREVDWTFDLASLLCTNFSNRHKAPCFESENSTFSDCTMKDDRYLFAFCFFDYQKTPWCGVRTSKDEAVLIPRQMSVLFPWVVFACVRQTTYIASVSNGGVTRFFALVLSIPYNWRGLVFIFLVVTERSGDFKAHDKKS